MSTQELQGTPLTAWRASLGRFGADESGATAIEYALIASGVSVAVIGGVTALGTSVKETLYEKLVTLLD